MNISERIFHFILLYSVFSSRCQSYSPGQLLLANYNASLEDVHLRDKTTLQRTKAFPINKAAPASKPKTNDDKACVLGVEKKSVNRFINKVLQNELSFVYLQLKLTNGLSLRGSKFIVGEDFWIWTYTGDKGGYEFLSWPIGFGVLSMGILNLHVGGPLDIELYNISGDCSSLQVGQYKTDISITKALSALTEALIAIVDTRIHLEERYDYSFLCYKRRLWIEPKFLFDICRNMFCPLEALQYSCRLAFYNKRKNGTDIDSKELIMSYDSLWWVVPMIITVLLFIYCPLIILGFAAKCSLYFRQYDDETDNMGTEIVFLDGTDHITIAKSLIGSLLHVFRCKQYCCLRVLRCLLPCLSLFFVILQIYLDSRYLKKIVMICVDKYVPMGFRTMLAGYNKSSSRYLVFLGGPYIACGYYILTGGILLITPKSVSKTLESGLTSPDDVNDISPLYLSTDIQERYGAVLINDKRGFERAYNLLHAQFNMSINPYFWKFILDLQRNRCRDLHTVHCLKIPFIFCVRVLEVVFSAIIYCCPITGFGIILFRSYRILIRSCMSCPIRRWLSFLIEVFLILNIVFFFFLFCCIFIDACCFICRLCIFTFTGLVVYPVDAYGYLIFFVTAIYYIWEYFNTFSSHYSEILSLTIQSCESLEKENGTASLVKRHLQFKGIKPSILKNVIEMYSPVRKRLLITFILLSVIIYVLGMSISLIMQRHEERSLPLFLHLGTTLFLCAFPKLIKSMCFSKNRRLKQTQERERIKAIVKLYLSHPSENNT